MLRSIGLTPRLVFLSLAVLWPALTAEFLVVSRLHVQIRDQKTAEIFQSLASSYVDLVRRYTSPGDLLGVRDDVFVRAVRHRREVDALALMKLREFDDLEEAEVLASEVSYGDEYEARPADVIALQGDDPVREVVVRSRGSYRAIVIPFVNAAQKFALRAEMREPGIDDADRVGLESVVLLGLAASTIVTVGFGLLVRLSIANPVAVLARAMADIREKKLGRSLPIHTEDQLGGLIRTFNDMSRTLKIAAEENSRLLAGVKNFNRELGRRVEVATRNLKLKNDILVNTQERLLEVQQQVSKLERAASLGQLSTLLAHELSTPLNVMVGHLELLEQGLGGNSVAKGRVTTLKTTVDRLVTILRDTLSAVRLPEPRLVPVDLTPLIEEMLAFLAPSLSARRIHVVRQGQDGPVLVQAERHQAQQVLLNVLKNAMDASPDEGTIDVFVEMRASNVAVSIRDFGKGIAEEHLGLIFEPYFTTKAPGRGTGIGLSVSSEIMRRHGGCITARNHPAGGAVFEIVFLSVPDVGTLNA